jgi:hypothetical protein
MEDFFMANVEWREVSSIIRRCVIDGEIWQVTNEMDGFFVCGPLWSKEKDCDSLAAAEEEIQNQVDERRAALAESRGQEHQAWCRGWERV